MDKMGLIVFAETGHVLGAFTRQGDPEGALDAEAVVGEGVWIRDEETGGRLLTVEARHLKVEVVDRSDRVLLDWQRYVVEKGVPDEPGQQIPSATLDGTDLTLTLPANATEEVEAWVQVEGGPTNERIVQKVEIPIGAGNPAIKDRLPLPAGDYVVLALVPGHRAGLTRVTIP
jgi:hypothetical protein